MKFALQLSGNDDRRFLTGAKAINLAKLVNGGFNVPSGFALSYEALQYFLAENGLQSSVDALLREIDIAAPDALGELPLSIRLMIENAPMPDDLKTEITHVAESLDGAVSVRSSSNLEDRANFSFAGQHDSYLNITGADEIETGVKRVWASAFSDRAMAYLRALSMPVAQVQMGVVIQQMIQADSAGVCFSIHPVSGDKDQRYINAAFGLGESTVSGQVSPDEILVNSESSEITYNTGSKSEMVVADANGGTTSQIVSDEISQTRVLSDEQIVSLTKVLAEIETLMGGDPQDVEWAFAADELKILQARPMVLVPESTGVIWKSPIPGANWRRNWRLGEWIPEAVTPLFATWILPRLSASREQFGTGTLGWEDMTSFSMPKPWFCLVNGYFFTRTDFPPFMANIDLKERMARMIKTGERIERWRTESLPAYVEMFERERRPFDVGDANAEDVIAFAEKLINEAGEFWSFIAPIGYGFEEMMFKPYYNQTLPDDDKPHHSVLFSGFASRMHDAQVALYRLSEKIRAEAATDLVMAVSADDAGFRKLPAWLQHDITSYDEEYGHQVVSLDVYFATLGETPEYTLNALQGLLGARVFDPAARLAEVQQRREEAVANVLSRLTGTKQQVMKDMIAYYQGNARVRENANFYLQIGWPHLRRAILMLGNRFSAAGVLETAEQVFFLEKDELIGASHLVQTGEPVASLSGQAQIRESLWQQQRSLNAPMLLSENVEASPANTASADQWDPEQKRLSAIGTSPGIGVGKVRIVITSEDAKAFKKGEVLVIKAASPLFTPMMLSAAALVVEVGGGASHSSLVARELGLPAVVNATDATKHFSNGDEVQVDGSAGEIRLLD